jgi:hypothetical protein
VALERARVLVSRADQELRQNEALAAQEQKRLAALEEQRQNELQRQAPSQWNT